MAVSLPPRRNLDGRTAPVAGNVVSLPDRRKRRQPVPQTARMSPGRDPDAARLGGLQAVRQRRLRRRDRPTLEAL